ncbi:hypothetical protein GCM10012287_42110 [Streptomyces daqingensis]|uniref:Methyltransferase type 11 domain-containing protein n=1 Tax=Streptomyces daqingensis TaxID=1472640 RepID=A0ABQ2MM32_9ACTN|nr:class I SAM-dependent methyltransferase [Streptomyces daqingensis]GGO54056.1 hypothetical protein GCM10012287_42110 [Streptomyces daqingensis]
MRRDRLSEADTQQVREHFDKVSFVEETTSAIIQAVVHNAVPAVIQPSDGVLNGAILLVAAAPGRPARLRCRPAAPGDPTPRRDAAVRPRSGPSAHGRRVRDTGGMDGDREADANRLAAESAARNDPTGWFEKLYAEAAAGEAVVPWNRDAPNPLLVGWAEQSGVAGAGRRALVVGCGLGQDAEYTARLGFRTTAFDISPTAVRRARESFPGSTVDYVVADLLDPPGEWAGAFDLVVESVTVQSLPLSVRARAIGNVAGMVAEGGELLVIADVREEGEQVDGPPWPLTRTEVDSFAVRGLHAAQVERVAHPDAFEQRHWRARFLRAT